MKQLVFWSPIIGLILFSVCQAAASNVTPANRRIGYVVVNGTEYETRDYSDAIDNLIAEGYNQEGDPPLFNGSYQTFVSPEDVFDELNKSYGVLIFQTHGMLIGSETFYVVGTANPDYMSDQVRIDFENQYREAINCTNPFDIVVFEWRTAPDGTSLFLIPPSAFDAAINSDNDAIVFDATCFARTDRPGFSAKAVVYDKGSDTYPVGVVSESEACQRFSSIIESMTSDQTTEFPGTVDLSLANSGYSDNNCEIEGSGSVVLAPHLKGISPADGSTMQAFMVPVTVEFDAPVSVVADEPWDVPWKCALDVFGDPSTEMPVCASIVSSWGDGASIMMTNLRMDGDGFTFDVFSYGTPGDEYLLSVVRDNIFGSGGDAGPHAQLGAKEAITLFAGSQVGPSNVDWVGIDDSSIAWEVVGIEETPDRFVVEGSVGLSGTDWKVLGEHRFEGLGSYRLNIAHGADFSLIRIIEVALDGNRAVVASVAPSSSAKNAPKFTFPSMEDDSRENIEESLALLLENVARGKSIESSIRGVVFAPGPLFDDINQYYIKFWNEVMGGEVVAVNTDDFPQDSESFRSSIRSAISSYYSEGVKLYHLVGDADEWEEFESLSKDIFRGEKSGDPASDLIPTHYFYDDDVLGLNRPYYFTDFPYSDVNGDGLPDVVVTRWSVTSSNSLLKRILTMIEYNKNRVDVPNLENCDVLALIQDLDDQDNSGSEARQIAELALEGIPGGTGVNLTSWYSSVCEVPYWGGRVADQVREVAPEVLSMWSPHSGRNRPNGLLFPEEFDFPMYPALVMANNCLTADFASIEGIGINAPCEKIWALEGRCIGWVGPTGPSGQLANGSLSRNFMRDLLEHPEWSMAEAFVAAQRKAIEDAGENIFFKKNLQTYVYLGDPFSRLEKKTPGFSYDSQAQLSSDVDRSIASGTWVDMNGDGKLELYLGNVSGFGASNGGSNCVFGFGPSGELLDLSGDYEGDEILCPSSTVSSAWGDFDNDGDPDVYLSNGHPEIGGGGNILLRNLHSQGQMGFASVSSNVSPEIYDQNPGGGAHWMDVNMDGYLDLVVARYGLPFLLFVNGGPESEYSLALTFAPGLSDVTSNGFFSVADFNNDSLMDLFLFGVNDDVKFLQNTGTVGFADVTMALGLSGVHGGGKSSLWGDWDNDGDMDLVFGSEHRTYCFENTGTGFVEFESGIQPDGFESASWVDFDLDGDLDLMVGRPHMLAGTTEDLFSYYWENMFPVKKFERMELGRVYTPNTPRVVSVCDYDQDGDQDLFVGGFFYDESGYGNYSLVLENGVNKQAGWLQVNLEGHSCNPDGYGAVVEAVTEFGLRQIRQVTGGESTGSQSLKPLVFGLGPATSLAKIRVRWPWGRITEVPKIEGGQIITISDESSSPRHGALYLSSDPQGGRIGFDTPFEIGDSFDFYLIVDFEGGPYAEAETSSLEAGISFPSHLTVSEHELLVPGTDSDPSQFGYKLELDNPLPVDGGPVALVRFTGIFLDEGSDPKIKIGNPMDPEFSDPVEPSEPSWVESKSGVRFRFSSGVGVGDLVVPLLDERAPALAYTGLFEGNRDLVLIRFSEPMSLEAEDGSGLLDLDHFRVFNASNPSLEKTILNVLDYGQNQQDLLLYLDGDILEGKAYNVEVSGLQDLHGNLLGSVVGNVTTNDDGSGGRIISLNEVLIGPPIGKSNSINSDVYWVELLNEGSTSVCLNGWTVKTSIGPDIQIPSLPVYVIQPGEYAVVAGSDALSPEVHIDSILFESELNFGEDSGLVLLEDPLGFVEDQYHSGIVLKANRDPLCSAQKFIDPSKSLEFWVVDAPEYWNGFRGTPGRDNEISSSGESDGGPPSVQSTGLLFAAPNPFNPETSIYLSNKESGDVDVAVYDVKGRLVKTLFRGLCEPTPQLQLVWSGRDEKGSRVASGVYFVKMKAAKASGKVLKVTLVK